MGPPNSTETPRSLVDPQKRKRVAAGLIRGSMFLGQRRVRKGVNGTRKGWRGKWETSHQTTVWWAPSLGSELDPSRKETDKGRGSDKEIMP